MVRSRKVERLDVTKAGNLLRGFLFAVSRVPSTIASPRNQIDFVLTIFFLQL